MASSSDSNRTSTKRSKFCPCPSPFSKRSPKSSPLQPEDILRMSNIVRSIDPTQPENSPKNPNGSGSRDQSSSLPRSSMVEAPSMALDKTINKGDPAPDDDVSAKSGHAQSQDNPISSSVEAWNSNAEPPKFSVQSIPTSPVDQSKSNNPPITEDMGIQDSQSGVGRRPDTPIPEHLQHEEPFSTYLNEEDYGREEDYDQEQDYDQQQDHGKEQKHGKAQRNGKAQKHAKKQKPSHDPTASDHSSPDSIGTYSSYQWCPSRSFFRMSLADIINEIRFEEGSGVTVSLECTIGKEDMVYRRKARTEERFHVVQQRIKHLIDTLKEKTPPNKKGDPTFEIIIERLGPRRWTS
ncbi:uncharacterized protein FMAN_01398 [Fusarium mangiferae]|uniref:Uncharacterized protein n=1 Tax=Fusarium mangiferae TaxID=192010 RepID=A0A1L7SIQ9_FUSMA|nr:uncharacterized protein FMAN_01398 [Fusarium mangiferae]CVK84313.1 uncharacterized protein FMAN_01398 [Fusarium mangiferae]